MHRDRSGNRPSFAARELRVRKFALVAVTRAKRRAQMLAGDFLKFGQMLFGGIHIAFALIGPRQTKFRRRMIGKNG